ncbi:MAG: multi-sensor hybrid histidine kinase [Caulobacteraceae bacterium]|nr:multi-sensor hybrid histidine kinase [Caulobacteraceae bacterium]
MDDGLHPATAQRAFLGSAPATKSHVLVASCVCILSVVTVLAVAPFSRVALPVLLGFIPASEAALWICDALTAVLLLAQFRRSRWPSILVLASGYLMSTFIILPHIVVYPGTFSPTGAFGGNGLTIAWLSVFWLGLFPLFVLAYSTTARIERRLAIRLRRPDAAIVTAIGLVLALVICAVWLATHPVGLLPVIEAVNFPHRGRGVGLVLLFITASAMLVLLRNWRRTVLDVWLMAVLCSWFCNIAVSAALSGGRYDVGWYAGHAFALAAGALLLIVLMLDLGRLYDQLEDALDEARARNEALVRSREELLRVQRLEAIGQLTGGIAHDFNNILTAVIGCLEMIDRRPAETDRVLQLSRHAIAAADRGAQLIKQLLTFSRRQNLHPEVLDANTALLELRALTSKALGERIDLSFDLEERLDVICVDPAEFHACILNLISNAGDAMPEGGAVHVKTRNVEAPLAAQHGLNPGKYILISIADTGQGMDPATLARAFEPFFTTKEVGKGTGLGLSHVHGFAQSAGGAAEITSVPGEGATVCLWLPSSTAIASPSPGSKPIDSRARSARVLLVEDDPDVRATTADCLREAGYQVMTAPDGDAALAVVQGSDAIDILLSDVAMPGTYNGLQLATEALKLHGDLKILLISGYSGALLESRGDISAFPALSKPYHREELLRRLDQLWHEPRPQDRDLG